MPCHKPRRVNQSEKMSKGISSSLEKACPFFKKAFQLLGIPVTKDQIFWS